MNARTIMATMRVHEPIDGVTCSCGWAGIFGIVGYAEHIRSLVTNRIPQVTADLDTALRGSLIARQLMRGVL